MLYFDCPVLWKRNLCPFYDASFLCIGVLQVLSCLFFMSSVGGDVDEILAINQTNYYNPLNGHRFVLFGCFVRYLLHINWCILLFDGWIYSFIGILNAICFQIINSIKWIKYMLSWAFFRPQKNNKKSHFFLESKKAVWTLFDVYFFQYFGVNRKIYQQF